MLVPLALDTSIGEVRNYSARLNELESRIILGKIRAAIFRYYLDNSATWPGSAETQGNFEADIAPYEYPSNPILPACKVGALNNLIRFANIGYPFTGLDGDSNPTKGWLYDYTVGSFQINYNATNADGVRYDRM